MRIDRLESLKQDVLKEMSDFVEAQIERHSYNRCKHQNCHYAEQYTFGLIKTLRDVGLLLKADREGNIPLEHILANMHYRKITYIDELEFCKDSSFLCVGADPEMEATAEIDARLSKEANSIREVVKAGCLKVLQFPIQQLAQAGIA